MSGELVEREVVAQPVATPGMEAFDRLYPVEVHNHYAASPVFEEPVRELVPTWLKLFAYVLVIAFVIFATVSVMAGPPWAPDHQPRPAQHQSR